MSEAKQALWQKIQKEHRELAAALKAAHAEGSDQIDIDTYPVHTVDWIWGALKRQKPELSKLIAETLRPMAEVFDGPGTRIEIETADLIEALLLDEGNGGERKCKRAAAA